MNRSLIPSNGFSKTMTLYQRFFLPRRCWNDQHSWPYLGGQEHGFDHVPLAGHLPRNWCFFSNIWQWSSDPPKSSAAEKTGTYMGWNFPPWMDWWWLMYFLPWTSITCLARDVRWKRPERLLLQGDFSHIEADFVEWLEMLSTLNLSNWKLIETIVGGDGFRLSYWIVFQCTYLAVEKEAAMKSDAVVVHICLHSQDTSFMVF